ncbi:phenylalanyl-tRNA synthetase subunit beta [Mycoplasmopsis canis UF31]|uniref:phenylalanine--tRNA ligase subunit beta n=1 Tax=Mycoplasmopsis canis TaxID=29555 RepID=UPI00025ACFA6|nr:phenylalanine--tRNA ligase subunit beta [Mycoplasmopsis canis]EIE40043.1 phenylalanyl-tRNA synthetase subunit beta [Mycoplasmopsis canis UF31]
MILSLKHLNKYLPNINLSSKDVERALNELGFEVEEIKPFSNVTGVTFAKVMNVYQNPNSDRLDVVELSTKNGNITIQTNNRILKNNDLVICFPVGATKDGVEFKEVELKGIKSQGMMASWSEIGYQYDLLSEKDQLLVLPNDFASINDDAMELLGINDTIIEISTTANRNDVNSYYFLAKELAAYFETEFKPLFSLTNKKDFDSKFKVDKGIAKELSFLEVHGKSETSLYEKMLLAKHGISSLFDWAVNLTNLTLLEIGSPAHVYNAKTLTKNLKAAMYSGKLELLGKKEVEVKNVLAINDDEKVISLASVMGIESTKTDTTNNEYLFEIGVFDSKLVRHGAKEIKLSSNSSNQGSRFISQEVAKLGMEYIRSKTNSLAISQIIGEISDLNQREIKIDNKKLQTYSGIEDLTVFDKAKKQLESLGFIFKKDTVLVPNYRYDVSYFEDIIEELFRFYSYQKFMPQSINITSLKTQKRDKNKLFWMHQGYSETRTFTLVSKEKNKFNPLEIKEDIDLITFVSKERESVRKSIITSLQEVVEYNQKRKLEQINIFEEGMVSSEEFVYGLASTTKSFKEIKQDIINFLNLELSFKKFDNNELIHPNVSAKILYNGNVIGWIGKIHPKYDETNAYYAEFIVPINHNSAIKFSSIDLDPMKTIDLTFEINNNSSIEEAINKINTIKKPFEIKVVDDYKKEFTHNVTLRITDQESVIEEINKHFN